MPQWLHTASHVRKTHCDTEIHVSNTCTNEIHVSWNTCLCHNFRFFRDCIKIGNQDTVMYTYDVRHREESSVGALVNCPINTLIRAASCNVYIGERIIEPHMDTHHLMTDPYTPHTMGLRHTQRVYLRTTFTGSYWCNNLVRMSLDLNIVKKIWFYMSLYINATGLTHAKLVSQTSPCCSGWPAPMNTPQGQQRELSSDGCADLNAWLESDLVLIINFNSTHK